MFQYQKRMEAERIRQEEEARLRKKMNEKKAKEEADRLLQMRLADIDREVEEEDLRQREEAKLKLEQIEIAEKRRNEPVSDQNLVGSKGFNKIIALSQYVYFFFCFCKRTSLCYPVRLISQFSTKHCLIPKSN